jgi:hypothetical protein
MKSATQLCAELQHKLMMICRKNIHVVLFLFIFGHFMACNTGENADQAPVPDVSHIRIDLKLDRFEQDFFRLDTQNFVASLAALRQRYPDFLPAFQQELVHFKEEKALSLEQETYEFLTAPQVRRLNDSVQVKFPQMDQFKQELTRMFQLYQHYFPQQPVPRVVTAVSELGSDAWLVNDTLLMIGLDYYLGKDFLAYDPTFFPDYMRAGFVPEKMIVKAAFVLADRLVAPAPKGMLVDEMIRNGKVLHIMDCILPEVPDHLIMGYSPEKYAECVYNESEIWNLMLEKKMLYENASKHQKMLNQGPNSGDFFTEAPGGLGNWTGWQIVKSYLKRQSNTTLSQLIRPSAGQEFLEKAKYKPKKK